MSQPLASVVFSTFNRGHLLYRSIEAYNRLNFDLSRLEIIVVDDGSEDDTGDCVKSIDAKIDVKYVRLRKPTNLWRDCAATLNHGIRISTGDVIICTHPEVMFGRDTVTEICNAAKDGIWVSCRPYYLSPEDQENIDTVNWREHGLLEVRKIDGFYKERAGNPDYTPQSIESIGQTGKIPTWESFVIAGATRRFWSRFGGFIESVQWGSIDLMQHQRRNNLGIRCVTPLNPEAICVHQNHDLNVGVFKVTDRDIVAAHQNSPRLTPEQSCYPAVDGIRWGPI